MHALASSAREITLTEEAMANQTPLRTAWDSRQHGVDAL